MIISPVENKTSTLLTKTRWVLTTITINESIQKSASHLFSLLAIEFYQKEYITDYIFTQDRNTVLAYFKTNTYKNDLYIKPKLTEYFHGFKIDFLDYSLINLGAINSTSIAEILLSGSTKIITSIKETKGNWNEEINNSIGIPLNLSLLHSFGMNVEEMHKFFSYLFDISINSMKEFIEDFELWQSEFISHLKSNFTSQRESLVAYHEYLITILNNNESFDEDWLNTWKSICSSAYDNLVTLKKSGRLFFPQDFAIKKIVFTDHTIQITLPLFEQYYKFINGQLGMNKIFELNLIYSIKESLGELLNK